jgi:hypothetical protein
MIRSYAIALATAAVAASPALAAEVSGTIKSFHGPARVVVLDDKSQYAVAPGVKVPIFRAGDMVKLTVEQRGGDWTIVRMRVLR